MKRTSALRMQPFCIESRLTVAKMNDGEVADSGPTPWL